MAKDDFDALAFVNALRDRLIAGQPGTSQTGDSSSSETAEKGTKRSREESGDRDTTGRFVNDNKAAKKSKDGSVTDAIKAINAIYSESSKMPDGLKHQLAHQVCQSYGMNIDASVFGTTSSSKDAGSSEPAAEEEKKEQTEEQPVEGEIQDENKQEKESASSEPKEPQQQPPATTPTPQSFPRFNLNAFSPDFLSSALSSAFSDQRAQATAAAQRSESGAAAAQ